MKTIKFYINTNKVETIDVVQCERCGMVFLNENDVEVVECIGGHNHK
jgi:uncharacterized C2H2 Zn-finger protein